MLKKIKKFKINLRPGFVERAVRKRLNLAAEDPSLESIVEEEIDRLQKFVVPSALYNTYSKRDCPLELSPLWEQASGKAISISLMAATIGTDLEKQLQAEGDNFKRGMIESIAWEGVDQAGNFVYRLLGEEAKLESCETSPFYPLGAEVAGLALGILGGEKAGVGMNEQGQLEPLYSKVCCCFWTPVLKR